MLASKRLYPLIACAALVTAALAAVVGQIGPASYADPLNLPVSEYAVLDRGGATSLMLASLGVAALAVVAALRVARARVGLPAERLTLVWGAGLILVAALPAVLPAGAMEAVAQAHHLVAMAAFVAMPAAGGLMAARFNADERWRPVARVVEWLALAGGFGLLALTYVALPGQGVLIGLVEWSLVGIGAALTAVPAVRLARPSRVRSAAPASHAVLG
ncbi:DUF998 domain-containing protein [Streptosporangium sp. NPDC023615]|uniref:DUF998 domain-containing protein n=1 Tax=Streptosporangium sp. NPDC023615 TaxID=3154794 RepID=UPI0034437B5C